MSIRCPSCKNDHLKYLFPTQDRLEKKPPENHALYQCKTCDLVFLFPQTTQSNFQEHYGTAYISHQIKKDDTEPKRKHLRAIIEHLRAQVWQHLFQTTLSISEKIPFWKQILLRIFRHSKWFRYNPLQFPGNQAKLLDFGCGVGTYLKNLKKRGWNIYGIEPSPSAASYCQQQGLDVRQGFSLSENWPESTFDIITLNQVFEHISDPNQTLVDIHQALKPDGILLMNVPNFQSVAAQLFKSYWFNLDTPRHNFLFTPKTLRKLLSANGFEILSIYTASSAKGWSGSMEYILRDALHFPIERDRIRKNNILNACFIPIARIFDWLGIGDNLFIIARKSSSLQNKKYV